MFNKNICSCFDVYFIPTPGIPLWCIGCALQCYNAIIWVSFSSHIIIIIIIIISTTTTTATTTNTTIIIVIVSFMQGIHTHSRDKPCP